MKPFILPVLAMAVVACGNIEEQAQPVSAADSAALEREAKGLVKAFAGELKPTLKQAIMDGGFGNAVEVCASEAPAIAARVSAQSGWQLKRVSLKPRNTGSASADAWERQVLRDFDTLAAADSQAMLEQSLLANGEFRFMKGQKVEGLCMACHGSNLAPEAKAALQKHYPDDSATGYAPGQVRGAFSLRKAL